MGVNDSQCGREGDAVVEGSVAMLVGKSQVRKAADTKRVPTYLLRRKLR